jgi:uncharacterized membrane protein YbhN (UPF0104 family)
LLIVGLSLFAWALKDADLSRTAELIRNVGPAAALLILPQGIWTVMHAWSWQRVLVSLEQKVPVWPLVGTFFTMEAAHLTIPGGPAVSESLGVFFLGRRFGVTVADAVASQAIKKLLVVSTNGLYAAIGAMLAWNALPAASARMFGEGSQMFRWLVVGTAVVLLTIAAVMFWGMKRGSLAMAVFRVLTKIPIKRFQTFLRERSHRWAYTDAQLARPLSGSRVLELVPPGLILLLQWCVEGFEAWLILHLLGADVTFGQAFVMEVAGSTLRSLVFAIPAGLGVQDAGYVAMLGAFGVPGAAEFGAAFVLLKRSKELFWIGFGWALMLGSRTKRGSVAGTLAGDP